MKKVEIIADCVCSGRNMAAGMLIDIEDVKPGDLAVLIGSNLAREVERYEIPEQDLKVVNRDPKPAKRKRK